jgi:2'-5' RNA ligase
MMSLEEHYARLWETAREVYAKRSFVADRMIDVPDDMRRGLVLTIKPPVIVREQLNEVLHLLNSAEPEQYLYPPEDLHFTVMAIVSCREGFTLSSVDRDRYVARLKPVLENTKRFSIHCRGINAFSGGVILQGFPLGPGLSALRESLREVFRNSSLFHTIDNRYRIETCHSTLMRFRRTPGYADKLLDVLKRYRTTTFGSFEVQRVDLVMSDWYQRKSNTVLLETFDLRDDEQN